MNSIKSKTNNYSIVNDKAVAGVVLIPEAGFFKCYVAWEWEDQAQKKFFGITESSHLIGFFNSDWINNVADYGYDVSDQKSAQKLFPNLF